MDGQRIDQIARSLAGAVSRRGALQGVAVALLAGALPAGVSHPVEAASKAKKRCLKKKGAYLKHGVCHCALTCQTEVNLTCQDNDGCFCGETVEGPGACIAQGAVVQPGGCAASSECPTGAKCVRIRNCPQTIVNCTTTTDCESGNACLNGHCQRTFCFNPCPAI